MVITDSLRLGCPWQVSSEPPGLKDMAGRYLANFIPHVLKVYRPLYTAGGNAPDLMQIELIGDDGPIGCMTLSTDQIDSFCPSRKFPQCYMVNTAASKSVQQFIRWQFGRFHEFGILFTQLGWNILPYGQHVFVAGDRVFGLNNHDYLIDPRIANLHLLADPDRSAPSAVEELLRQLALLPEIFPTVFIFSLLSTLRSAIIDAGLPYEQTLYLYGLRSTGKTTLARAFFNIYQYADDPVALAQEINAGSTKCAPDEKLILFRDANLIVDDICASTSAAETNRRMSLFSSVIRKVGAQASIERYRPGGQGNQRVQCGASAVFTAEMLMRASSEMTRTISIQITRIPTMMPHLNVLIATVLSAYLSFFAAHYDEELNDLRAYLDRYAAETAKHQAPRLFISLLQLSWASISFQRFLKDLDDSFSSRFHDLFSTSLLHVRTQVEQLLRDLETTHVDPLSKLFQCIQSGKLKLASGKHPSRAWRDSPHNYSGMIKDGIVYLPLKTAVKVLTEQGCTGLTVHTLSDLLAAQDLLVLPHHNKQCKRSERTTKGPTGEKVIRIRYKELKKLTQ